MKRRIYAVKRTAKKSKSYARRKTSSFSRPVGLNSYALPSVRTPMPNRLYTKLIYAQNGFTTDLGIGGTAGVQVMDLNSLFDPDTTGAGHQPAGFDQIMAIYEEYLVYGVAYKICCANGETSSDVICGVTATDAVTANSDVRVYMENGMSQWKVMANKADTTGERIVYFSGYVDLSKLHGIVKQNYLNESAYIGTSTTSPSDRGFLHLWSAPNTGVSDVGIQAWSVELTYYCIFKGGKLNALS